MASRPAPSSFEVERAFADAMQAAGYMPGPIQTNTKGFVRFDAPGDKKGRENGYYRLVLGQYPVGWFGDWKSSAPAHQWQWDFGTELSKKERDHIKAEHRRLKAEAEMAREAKQREVAERASDMWKKASTDCEGHPYLKAKGIAIPRGVRIHVASDGTRLLAVPLYEFDMAGNPRIANLQLIGPDGAKRFLSGGRKQGCFFSLKGDTSVIVICEGVATGFSIWQSSGLSVVPAFDSGNLVEVAKEIARYRPLATLLIAGDNDEFPSESWVEQFPDREWVNVGVKKAEAAAKAVGCRWITPVFQDGAARDRTDFNDLHLREGEKSVGAQVIGALRAVDPEPGSPGAEIIEPDFVQDESWRTALPRTATGKMDAANVEAVAVYLQNHRLLRNRLGFNTLTQAMELDGNDMADHHVAEFRRLMHADGLKAKKSDVVDEMIAEARRHTSDPLADYLAGLKWDGKPRLNQWTFEYLGCELTPYTRVVGRKFLIGAVARALDPGCKLDTCLILEGPQGAGKSTAARYLFGDRFFVDNLPDFHSKDSFQQLQGYWCVEIAELAALGKAEVGDVKKFLSRLIDVYRPPFGKLPIKVPRRCVFVGTVNPEDGLGYLKDSTGGRRFWPVTVGVAGSIHLDRILQDRDQLWAEAVSAYRSGELWYLTEKDDIEAAREEQELRREVDPWEESVRQWMIGDLSDNVTVEEVLASAVKISVDRQDGRVRRRMANVLRQVGWESKIRRAPGQKPALRFTRPGSVQNTAPADDDPDFFLPDDWK